GKQVDQHYRLVMHLEAVRRCDLREQLMPDIGPRGLKRKIIVDLARHANSTKNGDSRSSQQTRQDDARSIHAGSVRPAQEYCPAAIAVRRQAGASWRLRGIRSAKSMR